MTTLVVKIDRLRDDLQALAKIGYNADTDGINRPGLSRNDYGGRLWLIEQFRKLGLAPYMDGALNVICRYGDMDAPAVMIGSHLDSVPDGGMFDGSLGVLTGLECMRVIKETGIPLQYPLEVVAFSEEEGRFGGMFGVQALCGQITQDWIENVQDTDGIYLKDDMRTLGHDPMEALKASRDPKTIRAYLELHIEQGPVLESLKCPIGLVEGITGVFDWTVRLIGEANHSGTTPMDLRKDALMALCDFGHQIPHIIAAHGSDISRLTIGKVTVKPGFSHIVPGEVEFSFNGRDINEDVMRALAKACHTELSSIAQTKEMLFEHEEKAWLSPKECAPDMIDLLERQANTLGYPSHRMPSGAGHDAQFMSDITKTGMIFVPSVGGISHSPKEFTDWDDIEKGANVMLGAASALVSGQDTGSR